MAQEQKNYTYISGVTAKDEQNGDFVFVTLVGFATRAANRKSEKAPVTASLAINNRTKTVNKLMGTNFTEDTVWVRLNFWNERDGENFLKYMNGRNSGKVVVSGKLTTHEYNGNVSLDLGVFTWSSIWTGAKSESDSAAPAQPTPAQAGGFTEVSDGAFGEDDDAPF